MLVSRASFVVGRVDRSNVLSIERRRSRLTVLLYGGQRSTRIVVVSVTDTRRVVSELGRRISLVVFRTGFTIFLRSLVMASVLLLRAVVVRRRLALIIRGIRRVLGNVAMIDRQASRGRLRVRSVRDLTVRVGVLNCHLLFLYSERTHRLFLGLRRDLFNSQRALSVSIGLPTRFEASGLICFLLLG